MQNLINESEMEIQRLKEEQYLIKMAREETKEHDANMLNRKKEEIR